MPTGAAVDALDIPITVDWTASEKGIQQWNNGWLKSMRGMEKASKTSMKGAGKAMAEFFHKTHGAHKMWSKEIDKADQAYKELGVCIGRIQVELDGLTSAIEKEASAGADANKDAIKGLRAREKVLQSLQGEQLKVQESIKDQKIEIEEKFTFDEDEIMDAAKAAGDELVEPLTALMQKDIPRSFATAAKLGGAAFEKIVGGTGKFTKGLGKAASSAGDTLLTRGKKMMKHGTAMQKVGGAGEMAGGAALKAIGGLAKSVGPLLETLAKIGPMIGAMSTLVVGLVKTFIDAEASAKEINKTILATSSATGLLQGNFARADVAASTMEDTLHEIRDAAMDTTNIDWSITKEDHAAVLASLGAEGVSLQTLQKQYAVLNATSAEYSKSIGSVTQMTTTYSRIMGVSLGEINSLFGEMMTEMGSGLGDVQKSFSQMAVAAGDSGIAGNKFFSIIRGVSSDLALYNTRMEDAVKLLGMLGQVMSPRNAAKFMNTAMNAVKGMGRIQRLQTTILAGGAGKEIEHDLTVKIKDISGKIGMTPEALRKAVQSGNRDEVDTQLELLKKTDPEAVGTLSEAVDKISMQYAMSQKGQYGQAQAAGEVGAAGQLAIMQKALARFGGGKTLREGAGTIGEESMADNLGVSRDQLAEMIIFENSIEKQRRLMIKNAKDDHKYDKDDKGRAAELKRITEAGSDEIFNEMGQGDKDQVEADKKRADLEAKYAKEQGTNVFNIMDKLGVLVDFMMGQFYAAVMGIWDALLSMPGVDDGKRADVKLLKAVGKISSPAVAAAAGAASKADPGQAATAFKNAIMGSPEWSKLVDTMRAKQTDPKKEAARQAMLGTAIASMSETQAKEALARSKGVDSFDKLPDAMKKSFLDAMYKTTSVKKASGAAKAGGDMGDVTTDTRTFLGGTAGADALAKALGGDAITEMATQSGWASQETAEGQAAFAKMIADMQKQGADAGLTSKDVGTGTEAGLKAAGVADLAKAGLPPAKSISVHDHHAEPLLKNLLDSTGTDEDAADLADDSVDTLDLIYKQLKIRGIKIEKIGNDKANDAIHDAVLDAARQALVEYYLMQKVPAGDIQQALQGGASGADIMQQAFKDAGTLPANAAGGLITGITDGMAMVRAAPGEGLASVGPGETINGPGGGGGGSVKVELSLKGDLGRIIDARADDRYSANKGREKYR